MEFKPYTKSKRKRLVYSGDSLGQDDDIDLKDLCSHIGEDMLMVLSSENSRKDAPKYTLSQYILFNRWRGGLQRILLEIGLPERYHGDSMWMLLVLLDEQPGRYKSRNRDEWHKILSAVNITSIRAAISLYTNDSTDILPEWILLYTFMSGRYFNAKIVSPRSSIIAMNSMLTNVHEYLRSTIATFYILSAHPTTVHPIDTLCETFSPMCRGLYDFIRLYDERLAKGKNPNLTSLMNSLDMVRSDDYGKVSEVYIGESYATGGQHMVERGKLLSVSDILQTELREVQLVVYLSQYSDIQLYEIFSLSTGGSVQHSSRANLIGIVYDIISFGILVLPIGVAENLSMISIVDDQITSLTRSEDGWFNELAPTIMNKLNFQSYMIGLSMPNIGRELSATYMAGRFVKETSDLRELSGRLDLLALFYIFLTYYFSEGSSMEISLQILDRFDSLNDNKLDIPMFEIASGNVPILMISEFVTFNRLARRLRMNTLDDRSTSTPAFMLSIIMRLANIPSPNMKQAIIGMALPKYGLINTNVLPYDIQPIILRENEYNLGKYLERLALQRSSHR